MRTLARIGCLARSFVYLLIGIFALLVAMGNPYGKTTDATGVLRRLLEEQAFGRIILLGLAAALFCYTTWRILQAWHDHEQYGRTWPGLSVRWGFFFSGLAYGLLGAYAVVLTFGLTPLQSGSGERMMARWMLLQPLGRFVLMLTGIGVVLVGFLQFVQAFAGTYLRDLELPKRHARWLTGVCSFGLIARGLTFAIVGVFFFNAGLKSRSREAGGLHKAWETLRQQPFGDYLLGLVAIGFIAFALFGVVEGFYRRSSAPRSSSKSR